MTATRTIEIHEAVLDKNRAIAEQNRALLATSNALAINLMSSPGAGKTSLLERTLTELSEAISIGVIVGDLATDNDGRRLGGRNAQVIQITTGDICHLDASMVRTALASFDPVPNLVFIENVGNMVCPAAFDLGERVRVALLSVTEGEDKPLKYPTLFRTADAVIVTKLDIAEVCEFDAEAARANIVATAPNAVTFWLSVRTGAGMEAWYQWLRDHVGERTAHGDAI